MYFTDGGETLGKWIIAIRKGTETSMERHVIKKRRIKANAYKMLLKRRIRTLKSRHEERMVGNLLIKTEIEVMTDTLNHRGTSIWKWTAEDRVGDSKKKKTKKRQMLLRDKNYWNTSNVHKLKGRLTQNRWIYNKTMFFLSFQAEDKISQHDTVLHRMTAANQ